MQRCTYPNGAAQAGHEVDIEPNRRRFTLQWPTGPASTQPDVTNKPDQLNNLCKDTYVSSCALSWRSFDAESEILKVLGCARNGQSLAFR
eukprot:COSAG05_NODE_2064_length_3620_cov_1.541323_5_plen_90_part_00